MTDRRKGRAGGVRTGLAVVALLALTGLWWAVLPMTREASPPVMPPPLTLAASAAGVSATLVAAAEGGPTGTPVPLHVAGPVAAEPASPHGFRHGWPGIVVQARFAGPAVTLRLVDPLNRWRVTVDGQADILLTRPGDGILHISGLPDGPHLLRAEKLSESWQDAVFGGVFVPSADAALPAPPPRRRIEVFGDSDALGYGLRSEGRTCPGEGVFLATDATGAFPARVAQAVGADLHLVARSGIGLIRDFSPDGTGGRMLDLADDAAFSPGDALPSDPGDRLVIVALGANDFETALAATDPWPDDAALAIDFAAALHDFVRDQAGDGPSPPAQVLLVAFGDYGDDLVAAHRAALAALQADGISASLVILPKMARRACDWHMDAADHAEAARLILAAMATLPQPWLPPDPAG